MHAEYSHTYPKLTCARLRMCHRNDDSAQPRNRSTATDPFPLLRVGSGDEITFIAEFVHTSTRARARAITDCVNGEGPGSEATAMCVCS